MEWVISEGSLRDHGGGGAPLEYPEMGVSQLGLSAKERKKFTLNIRGEEIKRQLNR